MKEITYTVHIESAEEGGFIAYFPALPGCHTQGGTFEQTIAMAKNVLAGYLEMLGELEEPFPVETSISKAVGFEFPLSIQTAGFV